MPIVFVLDPVGGPTSERQWQAFQCWPIGAEIGLRGRDKASGDALIGGVGVPFTYRSRWPLFTFYGNGAWFVELGFWLHIDSSALIDHIER